MFTCELTLIDKECEQSIKLDGFYDSRCKDEVFEVIKHAAALGLGVVVQTEYYDDKENE